MGVHAGEAANAAPSGAWMDPAGSWRPLWLRDSVPWKLTAGAAGPGAGFTREGTAAQL